MAPEQFWKHSSETLFYRFTSPSGRWISIYQNGDVSYQEETLELVPHSSRQIGRFFLTYAYSTPAGVAYRLTYGISKEQPFSGYF